MFRLICLFIGYFLGCILTAEIVVKKVRGVSVFTIGTGNPGMANVMAQCGFVPGICVLAGDLGKTVLACVLARFVLFPTVTAEGTVIGLSLLPAAAGTALGASVPDSGAVAAAWAGLGAVLGHNYPFWHRFRGGKGVSVTCAAIFCLDPVWGLLAMEVGMFLVFATQYLPVGAIFIPAAFIPMAYRLFGAGAGKEIAWIMAAQTVIMFFRHLPGLRNIPSGKEKRINVTGLLKKKFGKYILVFVILATLGLLYLGIAPWYRTYVARDRQQTCGWNRQMVALRYMDAMNKYREEHGMADGSEMPDLTTAVGILADAASQYLELEIKPERFTIDEASHTATAEIPDECRAGGVWTVTLSADDADNITMTCTVQEHYENGSWMAAGPVGD